MGCASTMTGMVHPKEITLILWMSSQESATPKGSASAITRVVISTIGNPDMAKNVSQPMPSDRHRAYSGRLNWYTASSEAKIATAATIKVNVLSARVIANVRSKIVIDSVNTSRCETHCVGPTPSSDKPSSAACCWSFLTQIPQPCGLAFG